MSEIINATMLTTHILTNSSPLIALRRCERVHPKSEAKSKTTGEIMVGLMPMSEAVASNEKKSITAVVDSNVASATIGLISNSRSRKTDIRVILR